MIPVANMECVRIRPFEQVADNNHQATVNMIARSGAYARARAQARGWAPAPLPARVAMALAPPSNFLRAFSKHHYGFETLSALIFISGVEFIELHGPDGQRALLNPKTISSLREPIATDLKHFTGSVRCVVVTTNGKFIAVVETCNYIRDVIGKSP